MTNAEQVKEWVHFYGLLKTDQSKFVLFAELKQKKTQVSKEVLDIIVAKWLKE